MIPPKPKSRPEKTSLWRYMRLFRRDILSAQPEKLYSARMAEFRTPFFRSFLVNEPDLVQLILKERPRDFPKSDRIGSGLAPLLGESVFLTNGAQWERQRRIIDPAFEGGRLRETYPAMWAAAQSAVSRLPEGPVEIEAQASFAAADVIFRTLFSLPIEDKIASDVFREFRAYQREQPLLNLRAFIAGPKWMPRLFSRRTKKAAVRIRDLIRALVEQRMAEIETGQAPDDLATKIMTTRDPETGALFDIDEMVDQVAIFFLAGHETSASALGWALYLVAAAPHWQDKIAAEAIGISEDFRSISALHDTRNVFREALRLYPPVPMMVRETTRPECFRKRQINPGAQIVISPWHLHRHTRRWEEPDAFDPARWTRPECKEAARQAYLPFSAGPRVCPGAGFAMVEGVLLLASLVQAFRFEVIPDRTPVPEAQLTVRAREGIWLHVSKRSGDASTQKA